MPKRSELLTVAEAAALLRRAPTTLYQWRWRGLGPPAVVVNKRVLYRRDAIERWLDEHDEEPQAS
jgi:hypothetical protein